MKRIGTTITALAVTGSLALATVPAVSAQEVEDRTDTTNTDAPVPGANENNENSDKTGSSPNLIAALIGAGLVLPWVIYIGGAANYLMNDGQTYTPDPERANETPTQEEKEASHELLTENQDEVLEQAVPADAPEAAPADTPAPPATDTPAADAPESAPADTPAPPVDNAPEAAPAQAPEAAPADSTESDPRGVNAETGATDVTRILGGLGLLALLAAGAVVARRKFFA